ncbi:hypothetical protein [Sphingopyxis sp. GW247-27LB]|uniref:hypothetical protein n=1 Tax=Sphingopyxis sp. GW247-27LB TaxID=2012632 RepID=UPI0011410F14|nr:hypothetical protein [Sphingopyxis sp. GW247-27LB]
MEMQHKLTEIPYVTEDNAHRPELWPAVGKEISYSDACEIGRERARQIIAYMRSNEQAHMLLAHVNVAMTACVMLYGAYQNDAIAAFWRKIGSALTD